MHVWLSLAHNYIIKNIQMYDYIERNILIWTSFLYVGGLNDVPFL